MTEKKKLPDTTHTTLGTTTTIPSSHIVTTVTLPGGLAQKSVYDPSTPTNVIIADSTASSGIELETYYREEITETLERSRGLLDGGIKISFKLPEFLGGAELKFEREPKEETRKITREIFKPTK